MDVQDAQWYDDESRTLTGVAASSSSVPAVQLSHAQSSPVCAVSTRGVSVTKRNRQLVRYDSEQALNLFLNNEHKAGASSDGEI